MAQNILPSCENLAAPVNCLYSCTSGMHTLHVHVPLLSVAHAHEAYAKPAQQDQGHFCTGWGPCSGTDVFIYQARWWVTPRAVTPHMLSMKDLAQLLICIHVQKRQRGVFVSTRSTEQEDPTDRDTYFEGQIGVPPPPE